MEQLIVGPTVINLRFLLHTLIEKDGLIFLRQNLQRLKWCQTLFQIFIQ